MAIIPVLTKNGNQLKASPSAPISSNVIPVLTKESTKKVTTKQPKINPKPQPTLFDSAKTIFSNIQKATQDAFNRGSNAREKLSNKELGKKEALGASVGRTLQKTPNLDLGTKGQKTFQATDTETKIVNFISNFPSAIAQSYGKSLELMATPEGKKKIQSDAKNLPKTMGEVKTAIDNKDWQKALETALSNSALSVALDVSDFIPVSLLTKKLVTTGIKGSKSLLKKTVEEAVEEVEEKAVKTVAEAKPVVKVEAKAEVPKAKNTEKAGLSDVKPLVEEAKVKPKTNDQELISTYRKNYRKGKMLNTDDVREVYTPEGYNRRNSAEFHERSSVLSDKVFNEDIETLKPGDNYLFTAGVSGSGKSSALRDNASVLNDVTLGLDGNFSSSGSLAKVEKVLEKGANVDIVFTYRKPVDAWINGVVKRATNVKNGRVVPLEVFLKNLVDSKKRVIEAYEKFGEKVNIQVIDNSHGQGNSRVVSDPIAFLKKINYNVADEKRRILRLTEEKFRKGEIRPEVKESLVGKEISSKPQSKREKQSTASVASSKEVSVPRENLPVGKGQEKVSRLEARITESLNNAPDDVKNLSTYQQMTKKDQITKATAYVTKNPDEALAVLRGEKEAPKGLLNNSIYVAMQNAAEGDVELARRLASLSSTRAGQEISILTEIDPNSPVKVMRDIVKVREEAFTKRYGGRKPKEVSDKIIGDIKKKVKAPDKYDWNNFVKSLPTC